VERMRVVQLMTYAFKVSIYSYPCKNIE